MTCEVLKLAIEEYMNYYNYERLKTKLTGLSPVPKSTQPKSCIIKNLTLWGSPPKSIIYGETPML